MNYEYEINLIELVKSVLKKWKVILLSMIFLCLLTNGYAYLNTKTYYRAQATIKVTAEKTAVQKTDVFSRNDLYEKTISSLKSSTTVSEAKSNLTATRYDISNDIILTYRSTRQEAVTFLNVYINKLIAAVNSITGYRIVKDIDSHKISTVTIGPSKVKMTVLGAFIGLCIPAMFFALKFVFENKFRDKESVESVLKCKVFAETSERNGKYGNLLENIILGSDGAKVINFVSVDAQNNGIAKYIAEQLRGINKKVLLIDSGEIDELSGYFLSVDDVRALHSNDNEIRILTYKADGEVGSLLSDEYRNLLDSLREQYDYIIINSSSAAENNLAVALSANSDGTLFVVSKDQTNIKAAAEFVRELKLVNSKILGAIFNS